MTSPRSHPRHHPRWRSSHLFTFIIVHSLHLLHLSQPANGQVQPNLGTALADSLGHLSKSDMESLLKSYTSDSSVLDGVSTARPPFIVFDRDDLAEGAETINIPLGSSNLKPYAFNASSFQRQRQFRDYNGVNNKKREIDSSSTKDHRGDHGEDGYEHHHRQQLPLEKLFPQIVTTTHGSVRVTDSKGKHIDPENNKLTSALLNHSIHNNYESDDELDRLVFSQLPQGSKLILRTVKIVKTDEDGNEEPVGNSAVSWDMIPVNGTDDDEEFDDDGTPIFKPGKGRNPKRIQKRPEYGFVVKDPLNVSSIGSEDDDEDDDEDEEPVVAEGRSGSDDDENLTEVPGAASVRESQTLLPDQNLAGSHQTTQKYQKYKHGSNEREKEKTDKYFHGQDQSKENIHTKTDTDGKKITDYEGTEKGLTDYVNAHGKAVHDERERYKNSKKKNKGRKVTGFKRVYHKEEFQRTEHFYDDEEAKRIAESYGLTDQKEKSNHGTKQDKRKYHGTKIEHTDVDKLKKEKIIKDKHSKGAHHTNEHSDKHKQGQKYEHQLKSHNAPRKYGSSNKKNHYQETQQAEDEYQHPNHNYQGQYSVPEPQIGELVQYAPAQLVGGFTASSPAFVNKLAQKSPIYHPGTHRVVAHGSEVEPSILPMPTPSPMLAKPSEMKIFFAERERKIPDDDTAEKYYAPNFGPPYNNEHRLSESQVAALFGNANDNSTASYSSSSSSRNTRKLVYPKGGDGDRYANSFNSSSPDPIPEYYSTIHKLVPPLKANGKAKGKRGKKFKDANKGNGNLVDVQQSLGAKVASEIIYQPQVQYPRVRQNKVPARGLFYNVNGNRYSTWFPIGQASESISLNLTSVNGNEKDANSSTDTGTSFDIKPSPPGPSPHHVVMNQQLPQLLIAKPMPYRITRPTLNRQLAFRPYGAAVPVSAAGGTNHGPPPSHYYGTTIISQAPSTILRRIPAYSTHLMNGFVNSMTGMFGRVVG